MNCLSKDYFSEYSSKLFETKICFYSKDKLQENTDSTTRIYVLRLLFNEPQLESIFHENSGKYTNRSSDLAF